MLARAHTHTHTCAQPDAEEDIKSYIDVYRSGKMHPAGYHFAINTDVAMFNIYSTRKNRTAGENNIFVQGKSDVLGVSEVEPLFLIINKYKQRLSFAMLDLDTDVPIDWHVLSWPLLPVDTERLSVSSVSLLEGFGRTSARSNISSVLISFTSGAILCVQFDKNGKELSVTWLRVTSATIEFPVDSSTISSSFCDESSSFAVDTMDTMCVITVSAEYDRIVFSTVIIDVDKKYSSNHFRLLGSLKLSEEMKNVTDIRLVSLNEDSAALFVSSGGFIFGTEIWRKSFASSNNGFIPFVRLTVGTFFSVSVASDALMMVADNGYCFNSHVHNTRSKPMVCSSEQIPTSGVLQYSIGLVSDWKLVLGSSSASAFNATGYIFALSSCHDRILHGAYDQGSRPSVSLREVELENKSVGIVFAEVHEGLQNIATAESNGCGTPLQNEGLVLNSFDINSWLQNLRKYNYNK